MNYHITSQEYKFYPITKHIMLTVSNHVHSVHRTGIYIEKDSIDATLLASIRTDLTVEPLVNSFSTAFSSNNIFDTDDVEEEKRKFPPQHHLYQIYY